MESPKSDLAVRVAALEKRLRLVLPVLISVMLAATVSALYLTVHSRAGLADSGGVLRIRGLIVEDASGRERILIGAPVPGVHGRKRHDDSVGVILIGENGADRVVLGAPAPAPQIQGIVGARIGKATGLILDDANGDERGGFSVLDNDGRVSLGLDYPHGNGEAISLGVTPGETSLSIHDSRTITRASLVERNDAAPILFGLDFSGGSKLDMSILRLNPYRIRHVVTKASDEALNKALDDMAN
jgi:hypothetical protein